MTDQPTLERRGFWGGKNPKMSAMYQRFVLPPFSVLDARNAEWIRRKKLWIKLGLRGEVGRTPSDDDNFNMSYRKTLNNHGEMLSDHYRRKTVLAKLDPEAEEEGFPDWYTGRRTGISIFDPVLTELCYRWWCPAGGHILDPFAGGATRGVVATILGYKYTGVEIRQEQVDANLMQAAELNTHPIWIQGDSIKLSKILPKGAKYDMLFTCPPYYDREIYSSDKADGSTHDTYEEFIDWYRKIFAQAVRRLHDKRFAVVVVGEIRDQRTGVYRGFISDTIDTFNDLGLHFYNEAILITRLGSLRLRAGFQFAAGRKLGKTHQQVLVFWKGDPDTILEDVKDVYGADVGTGYKS